VGPFLAKTSRVSGDILVVEGWIWDRYDFRDAIAEFHRGSYKHLVVVGERAVAQSSGVVGASEPEIAARWLGELEFDEHLLVLLTTPTMNRDRTYTSAVCFRDWLVKNEPAAKAINLITVGVHARKSQILFQKALGSAVKVGVIAGIQNPYSVRWWWLSVTGIRLVLRNVAGYVYYGFVWLPPRT
jgi:hypothetical protein